MPTSERGVSGSASALAALIITIILIVPLFDLPRPSTVIGLPWKVELMAALGLLAATYVLRRHYAGMLKNNSVAWTVFLLIAAFGAWSLFSVSWAEFPLLTLHHTFLWGLYASVFVSVIVVHRSIWGNSLVINCLAVTAGILGIICLVDFVSIVDFASSEGTLRIRWAKYAELLVTISPPLWAAAIVGPDKRRRNLLLIAGALGWITAQLSLSKAAFISGIAGFVVFFVLFIFRGTRQDRRAALIFAAIWICLTASTQVAFTYFSTIPSTTQYITGTADASRETSSMRVFTWKVASQMIVDAPIVGVGADNFGTQFNDARRSHARAAPDDPDHAIGEDYLFERAHNEYLQILAELGIVGLGLFFALFVYVGSSFFKVAARAAVSPQVAGAAGGLAGFAISSLFTSFSFRAAQNGIVFFIVLAVLVSLIAKNGDRDDAPTKASGSFAGKSLLAFVLVSGICLGGFSLFKAAGYVLLTSADRAPDRAAAADRVERAIQIDPDPATAAFSLSYIVAKQGDPKRAAGLLRDAIAQGIGISVAYSRLSELNLEAGDAAAAIEALQDGIGVFPRSVYLRVRLALLLEDLDLHALSQEQFEIARTISSRDAFGWRNLIRHRSLRAHYMAAADPSITPPAALRPANAIYQYLDDSIPAVDPNK